MFTIEDVQEARTAEESSALITKMRARMTELDSEFEGATFDDAAKEEFASLDQLIIVGKARHDEFLMRRNRLTQLAQDQANVVSIGQDMGPRRGHALSRIPDDVFALDEYRKRTMGEPDKMEALLVDGAKKAVESASFPSQVDADRAKAHIHKLLDTVADQPHAREMLARHILGTGNPLYARGFAKGLASEFKEFGTPDMRAAIATVGTTTTGGYNVPFTLDPTLILTSDGQVNSLRGIARVESIVGNSWKGVSTAGVSASYGAEQAAVTADAGPTFGQPDVTVRAAKAEIKYSIESDEDWPRLQSEMARVLQDAKDALEADKFVNGAGGGSHQPEGIVAGLAATSDVGTGGNGFGLDDVDRLIGRLPDRWEPRARFLGHRAVYNEIERLDRAAGGAQLYRSLADAASPTLLGYPRHFASGMENDFVTEDNEILLFGDFSQFLIVDKIGLAIEVDPHVRDGDGKWTGQRALLAHWRNSSVILVDASFRLLKVGVVTS